MTLAPNSSPEDLKEPWAGTRPLIDCIGHEVEVTGPDGVTRRYIDLDSAASTPSSVQVAGRVNDFLPTYSSVHRGTGFKSRASTTAFEEAREEVLWFLGRDPMKDTAIFCRNTTEAINHLAYRLRLSCDDVVVTTVIEHHANLLPWRRVATVRYVECAAQGTFSVDDVTAVLDSTPRPSLLTVSGASNVTGWLPPLEAICDAAHRRGIRVVVDAAQLAPHRPVPQNADFVVFSGHKLYAPFGAGALVGPKDAFSAGDPFLVGGGAVDLVEVDDVLWSEPPDREEAGSPNVVGVVAMASALVQLRDLGWSAIHAHEEALANALRKGLAGIERVHLLGPPVTVPTLAVAAFNVDGVHHELLAARLSAEYNIAVRNGCFCAHPYLMRLLGCEDVTATRAKIERGDRSEIPGAVRASAGLANSLADIDALLCAVTEIASGRPAPIAYVQDRASGGFHPVGEEWALGSSCGRT